MAISIDVPTESANVKQDITLSGTNYLFRYTYNTRDQRLRLSIYLDDELVIASVKIMENQLLLQNYILPDFPDGDLLCVRFKGDETTPATLGNIGIDQNYELIYLTNEELEELQGNG